MMHLPLSFVTPEAWPFDLIVGDADGNQVIRECLFAHTSKDKTFDDAMSCRFHREGREEAAAANAEQVARLRNIILRVNAHDALVDALRYARSLIGPDEIIDAALSKALADAVGE
jgi:hypothetical protein